MHGSQEEEPRPVRLAGTDLSGIVLPADQGLDWEALRRQTRLTAKDTYRLQGLRAMRVFLLGYSLFTLFQVTSFVIWGDPRAETGLVEPASVVPNLAVMACVAAFILINEAAGRRNWNPIGCYYVSMQVLVVGGLVAWLGRIHLAGHSITPLTMSIPATAILVSWLLGPKQSWIYLAAGTVALLGLLSLERRGVLMGLPLTPQSYEIPLSLFLDFDHVVIHMVIYTAMSVLVLVVLNRTQKDVQGRNLQMAQLVTKLEIMATTDSLTTLLNRRSITAWLEREIARSHREGNSLALVLADIDHFKKINDSYGHAAGDRVLREISTLLWSLVRPYDLVARVGGEEFLIALPKTGLLQGAAAAERARQALADHAIRLDDGTELHVTLSFGCAGFDPGSPKSLDQLLKDADDALYEAKAEGRNRVRSRA